MPTLVRSFPVRLGIPTHDTCAFTHTTHGRHYTAAMRRHPCWAFDRTLGAPLADSLAAHSRQSGHTLIRTPSAVPRPPGTNASGLLVTARADDPSPRACEAASVRHGRCGPLPRRRFQHAACEHGRRSRVRAHFIVLRYATTSARSCSFLKPGKAMFVPLMYFFGFAR